MNDNRCPYKTSGDIMSGDIPYRDKTFGGTKSPAGQSVRQTQHLWGQNICKHNIPGTKHPWRQNIYGDKTSVGTKHLFLICMSLDVLYLWTFCPSVRFVPPDVWSSGCVVPPDVLSPWAFCPAGCFVPRMLCLWLLCRRTFCLQTLCPSYESLRSIDTL